MTLNRVAGLDVSGGSSMRDYPITFSAPVDGDLVLAAGSPQAYWSYKDAQGKSYPISEGNLKLVQAIELTMTSFNPSLTDTWEYYIKINGQNVWKIVFIYQTIQPKQETD